MAARGRRLFSLYIYIENFNDLLVRNHWTDFSITLQECLFCNPLPRLFKSSWFIKKRGCQGMGLYLAHLSTKCSWWAILVSQCPSCVVRRAASTIALKAYSSYLGQLTWYLVGSIGVTCRSEIAKIVHIGNPRWPPWSPSWKSIFRFFSWTERPIDSKLARNY